MKLNEMKKEYSQLMILRSNNFGAIEVYTYQEILRCIEKKDFSKYSFVILDEAHFFLSDAVFNCFTEEVMKQIVNKSQNTRRIYLTATPGEVLKEIYDQEVRCSKNKYFEKNELQVYVMDEDYSYLKPIFFNDVKLIVSVIKKSSDADYWLVFVREKSTGKCIREELSNIPGGVDFMTAETDKNSEDYQQLIQSEKLPHRVLIATKFLDVGVNITTDNLHIVVFEDDIVEIKQMIGRKRVRKNEIVEVYFYTPSYKNLKQRLAIVEDEIKNENKLIGGIYSKANLYREELIHPLFSQGAAIDYNALSLAKLEKDRCRYQELLKLLEAYRNDSDEYYDTYRQWMLAYFPEIGEARQLERNFDDEREGKVFALIEEYSYRILSKEEKEQFAIKLSEITGDPRKDKREERGEMGTNILNKVLAQYGFFLKSINKTPVEYELVKRGEAEKQ